MHCGTDVFQFLLIKLCIKKANPTWNYLKLPPHVATKINKGRPVQRQKLHPKMSHVFTDHALVSPLSIAIGRFRPSCLTWSRWSKIKTLPNDQLMVPRFCFKQNNLSLQSDFPWISGWYKTLPFPPSFLQNNPLCGGLLDTIDELLHIPHEENQLDRNSAGYAHGRSKDGTKTHAPAAWTPRNKRGWGVPGRGLTPCHCHVVMMMDSYTFRHGCIFEGRSFFFEIHSIIHVHLVNLVF